MASRRRRYTNTSPISNQASADEGSHALVFSWLKKNYSRILVGLALAILSIYGGSGLSTINTNVRALQDKIVALQVENTTLKLALEQTLQQLRELQAKNSELLQRIYFLEQCLKNPLPWPGGTLCPR